MPKVSRQGGAWLKERRGGRAMPPGQASFRFSSGVVVLPVCRPAVSTRPAPVHCRCDRSRLRSRKREERERGRGKARERVRSRLAADLGEAIRPRAASPRAGRAPPRAAGRTDRRTRPGGRGTRPGGASEAKGMGAARRGVVNPPHGSASCSHARRGGRTHPGGSLPTSRIIDRRRARRPNRVVGRACSRSSRRGRD